MSGIETQQSNETPREKIRRQTSENLNWLKDKIKLNNDPWITKQPTLENWAAVFGYKYMWWKWEIVTRKEGNGKYSVRIKKWIRFPDWKYDWQTQKNGDNKTFAIDANDKLTFNRKLWAALDTIIWKNRDRLPTTGWRVYDLLNTVEKKPEKKPENNARNTQSQAPSKKPSQPASKPSSSRESRETRRRTNLKEKPISLHFKEKNKERRLTDPGYPDKYSVEWRVTRCLRFASITDAVEDRYWIPRWLLMALMAQEWWWDPTVINQRTTKNEKRTCDWWAGLIHIQAANAAEYWMKTLPRYTREMADYKHWEELEKAKSDNHNDLRKLCELDDRFNPVMGIDLAARYLMEYCKWKDRNKWDEWLKSAGWYNSKWKTEKTWNWNYIYSVVVFWTTINAVRGNPMPTDFSKGIDKIVKWKWSASVNWHRENVSSCIPRTKSAMSNLKFTIDGQKVSSQEYYRYLQWQWDNYGLSDYVKYNREHPYKK